LTRTQLVDPLGRGQVLQPVLAKIDDIPHPGEVPRSLREKHLSAVADRRDPRGAVHIDADIALVDQERLTRMDAHPNAHRASPERRLALTRRSYSVARAGEGDEERVALRVNLNPVMTDERVAQHPPVLDQRGHIPVTEVAQQASR